MPVTRGHRRSTAPRVGRSRRIPALMVLLAAALITSGCASAPSPTPSLATLAPTAGTSAHASFTPSASPAVAPARWADCGSGFQCATVNVPTDYANPGAGSLNLSLVQLPARDPAHRIGSLFVNPGGPGGSGIDLVRDGSDAFPAGVLARFDLVGFDPRGVNLSSPVRCVDNLDNHVALDPSPDDPRELKALVDDARSFAAACGRRNGDELGHVSTEDVARDLDLLREAVGDDKLTYLGFSWGTLLGATYADLFPDRVRAMALDGAVDPALPLDKVRGDQAVGFETALRHFLDDCAERPECGLRGSGGPAAVFDRLMARIDAAPLPAIRLRDRRKVGPGLAWAAVTGALYSEAGWSSLEAALADAQRGDGSLFLAMSDPLNGRDRNGSYRNQIDAYAANTCADYPAPDDVADYTKLADAIR
ncbi:MAG TPA: alpha/beta fold hydrolase, partial [Candidatus Limnocylindrales bacterium]|nr:alpha/beta fold hydrolase [Candidatus Limnocylindrales bacterium]